MTEFIDTVTFYKKVSVLFSFTEKFIATTNALNSDSCTCRCHKPISPLNDEYLLFEQALKKTRQEQQQERLLNNNRLIQTLKRQHEELINIYQQNKDQKLLNIRKIDREQQTLKLNLHDSQIQTDLIVHNNSKISSQQQKFIVIPTINSHTTNTNGPQTATRNSSAFSNSMQTPSSSTLQQIIPRLPANIVAATAVTSKKPTAATKTAMVANSPSIPPLPPPPLPSTSTTAPHVVVDLTEEDEDDTSSRIPPQRTTPIRQVNKGVFSFFSSMKFFFLINRLQRLLIFQHLQQQRHLRLLVFVNFH